MNPQVNKKKIGLFFGSFNPIHIGHLIIAQHFINFTDIYQLWFVVSPHNPLKQKNQLLQDHHRLAMVKIAIDNNPKLRACDIEFGLPQPSYTIDTLAYLEEQYPQYDFALIMGSDNWQNIHKWKNYQQLMEKYHILVYPRPEHEVSLPELSHKIKIVNAPLLEISSSHIRQLILEGKSIQYLVLPLVQQYIDEMNFYKAS